MPQPSDNVHSAKAPQPSGLYDHLPDPIRLADTITSQESDPSPDPDSGRDPERDFMLRYAP